MPKANLIIAPDLILRAGTTRRRFLSWTALVGAMALTPGLDAVAHAQTGSGGSPPAFLDYPFALGVASGDPLPDSVVLWTRLAPRPLETSGGMPPLPIPVDWEVATDERFNSVVYRGTAFAVPESAHSVRIDVRGLESWRDYFYRFRVLGHVSDIGRTRTAPGIGSSVDSMAFAWASCQCWWDGHFTAYDDLADGAFDTVLHLGDYIYEGKIPDNGIRDITMLSAVALKETETLEEYRLRYGLHKLDNSIQRAHASAPWIVTLDDHEVDNNWAASISQDNDDPRAFLQRRANALRAWWEHTPTRLGAPTGPDLQLYRRFDYGDLARFSVLDTRQYRSNQANGDKEHVQNAETADSSRTMTGSTQESWILDGFDASPTSWNFLAHQTVMTDLAHVENGERLVGMDAWSGYEASRSRILDGARERGVDNLVSIVGDIHRNIVSELRTDYRDESAPVAGVEIAGTSISSGKDGKDSDDSNAKFLAANPSIKFGSAQRGYVACALTKTEWTAQLRVVDKVSEPGLPMRTRATVSVRSGSTEIDIRD